MLFVILGKLRIYGGEFKRLNQLLLARVERIDSQLAEYNEKHPNQDVYKRQTSDCTVRDILVNEGDSVNANQVLIVLDIIKED